jgi:hypothetical protein
MVGEAALLAVVFLFSCIGRVDAGDVTRANFVSAYVACNNTAWRDVSHALIPLVRSVPLRGSRPDESAAVRGLTTIGLFVDGAILERPNEPATVGWAAAAKAFADEGAIERHSYGHTRARATEREVLSAASHLLTARERDALATNADIAALPPSSEWVLGGMRAGALNKRLDRDIAINLLRRIGNHEAVGSARSVGVTYRACPDSVLRSVFAQ